MSNENVRRERRRLATYNPDWANQIVDSGSADCENHNGDIYFLPGIEEDPCKELCFFSIDNDANAGHTCSHLFYTKTDYFIGCFVILQGNANRNGNMGWIIG